MDIQKATVGVKRFNLAAIPDEYILGMIEQPSGVYVTFEDYERLQFELATAESTSTMGGDPRIQSLLDEILERAVHEKTLIAERDRYRAALERLCNAKPALQWSASVELAEAFAHARATLARAAVCQYCGKPRTDRHLCPQMNGQQFDQP